MFYNTSLYRCILVFLTGIYLTSCHLVPGIEGPNPDPFQHLSWNSLCCLYSVLDQNGITPIHASGHIKVLPGDSAITKWQNKDFLFLTNQSDQLQSRRLTAPLEWYKKQNMDQIVYIEFQQLQLGQDQYLATVYSHSPVTRITVLWRNDGRFLFSTPGDLSAVSNPGAFTSNYRLYFWNPTGSDLSIVDYNPDTQKFQARLLISESWGTHDYGSPDGPQALAWRKQVKLSKPTALLSDYPPNSTKKGHLVAGTMVYFLARYQDLYLIGYPISQKSKPSKYQPGLFFSGRHYSTAWIQDPEL